MPADWRCSWHQWILIFYLATRVKFPTHTMQWPSSFPGSAFPSLPKNNYWIQPVDSFSHFFHGNSPRQHFGVKTSGMCPHPLFPVRMGLPLWVPFLVSVAWSNETAVPQIHPTKQGNKKSQDGHGRSNGHFAPIARERPSLEKESPFPMMGLLVGCSAASGWEGRRIFHALDCHPLWNTRRSASARTCRAVRVAVDVLILLFRLLSFGWFLHATKETNLPTKATRGL